MLKAARNLPLALPASKPSFRFKPSKRLHYRWEYRRFFGKSERLRLSECVIYRIPNEVGHYRLGITVKARVNSVERNRVKRQVREVFRHRQAILGSFDYNVVIPSEKKAGFPFPRILREALEKELDYALG